MFANKRLVSAKNPVDHKLLMQIRNGHLNEGFNSRKSSSASTKPISKYNLLHSYFECNFSGDYSKRIAQELKRQIKSCNKYKQLEPSFIDSVRQKILYVHTYNVKVMKVTFAYPFSNEFVELLIQYILIEFRALYRRQDHIDVREASVRDRILRILMHIFNAFFESKMVPPKEIFEKSAKAIINIFIEIKRDYGVNNKLMENMTIKLLKRAGLFEEIEALKGKNLPCPLDTFLTDHAYSDIYKRTVTSDYGTDDGFQMDDDVQIVDDDIVDITASESIKVKEEGDDKILNKVSTSSLTKPVLTIYLDDSDFESDEETCCFTEEVKTSKKSLEYQTHQRQKDFHKRNHRPMDEVKTEAIKLDISEECNLSNTNSKPVNSDVCHSKATLISNTTIGVPFGGIPNHNQSNIKNRNMTKSATVETEIVEISDEEDDVETCDAGSHEFKEKNPGEGGETIPIKLISKDGKPNKDSLMELVKKIPEKGFGSQNEKGSSKEIANGLDLSRSGKSHQIEHIESSNALHDDLESEEISVAVAVGESNTRVVEIDSVEQPTDSCSKKITTIIDPSLYKMNKVSKEVGNMNQSSTPEVSETTVTSTTYTDTHTTENFTTINLIVDEIKISYPEKDVEIEEQLLENVETSRRLEENSFVVDNQPEPLPESVIFPNSTDNALFEIGTSRESINESICNSDSSSKIVTDGTLGKPFIVGTESNEDNVDLLSLPQTLVSNDNQGDILSKEKLNTVVNEKVIAKGLAEMGSHILSLRQIAENIIQNNRSGGSPEPFKSSVSTSVVSGEGEEVTAQEKPHDKKYPFSLQEPYEVKLSHASVPHQKVLEKNLGNIEDAITDPNLQIQQISTSADTLQNNVPDETEIDVKASLPDSFKNSSSQPTEEKISKQNDKEKSEDIILDNFENPEKDKQLHEVHESEYSGAIMHKPQKCCTQENVESNINGTFPNQNLDHSDELAEDQNPADIIEEASQSTKPLHTTLPEESNFDEQLIDNDIEKIDATFPNQNSGIKNETESERQSIQGIFETNFNKEDIKHDIPPSVEYAITSIKECGEESDHKMKGKAKNGENPIALAGVEELFQKPNEPLFGFHNEFAMEVEIGLEVAHSDADINHIELCNVTDPDKILSKEKLNTVVNGKVIAKGLAEMGSHILSLRQIAENIIQNNRSGGSPEPFKSSVSTSVVSGEGEEVTAEEKPHDKKYPFSLQEPYEVKLSHASVPHQKVVEKNMGNIEDAITDPNLQIQQISKSADTLQNNVLNETEIDVKASLPDSFKNSSSQPTDNDIEKIDATFPNQNSGIKNETESERQSIQGIFETNFNKEDIKHDIPPSVEYAITSIKECGEESDHKMKEKAKNGENPIALAGVEELFQKPNEPLFEFHNEFAMEVEIGSEAAHSDADINHIGLCNVTDPDKILSKEKLNTVVNGKVIAKGLAEMGSHILSLRQIAENIIQNNRSGGSPEPFKSSVSTSVVSGEGEEVTAQEKPHDKKYPFSLQEPYEVKLSHASVPHQKVLEKNLGNIEDAITDPNLQIQQISTSADTLQNNVLDETEIDVKASLPDSFKNSSSQPTEEKISKQNDKEKSEYIILDNFENPEKDKQLHEVHESEYSGAIMHKPQKCCTQENVESNINGTFPNQNLDHSDELAEDQNPADIIEEASQSTKPLHTTLPEESNFDEQLIDNDIEKIDATFPNQNSGIKNETDHKMKEKAKIGENPIALAGVEELFQKPNEPLFEFHNEFAMEVEIGSEAAHSDADINNIELCNVTDPDKIIQSDSFIEDQRKTSDTEKLLLGSPDKNVWRAQENLHTSIITESQDYFGQQDSGIASNSGSSDSQDNQSLKADLESEVDLSLHLKRTAEEKPHDKKYPFSLQEPYEVKLSHASVPHQKVLEKNLGNIEDAITDPNLQIQQISTSADTLQNNVLDETEIDVKASLPDSFKNSSSQPTEEKISKQNDKEKSEDLILDNFENPEKNKQLHEVHESEYLGAIMHKPQKCCTQENVESNINGTFPNQNLDHSDELPEDQNPTDIIEEASQSTKPLHTTLPEESNFDEQLIDNDIEKIDATFPNQNSGIKNETESERQSIQGIFETNFNKEDIKHDIPPSVEYAITSIKECGEESDHKMKEKAKIGENPIALAGVEELFQKPNEPLFEFHNEFAMEVEIGSEAAHSDADINNIELCNVTDPDKIIQSDSFIEDQRKTSDTEKLLLGSPDKNVWRAQENLHTSIITESQDYFGQNDSGIASNSGSSDSQDNQSLKADLESEVDLSLRLKRNVIDIFVQEAVPQEAFCPLDVLAGIAAEAPREIVIEEQKPLRRGRSSKAENDNVNELFKKIKFSQKKQPSNSKVSKYKSKIDLTSKPRTHQTAKKVVKVIDSIRVTRSSHLKNSNENVDTSFKPDDFLSVKKSIPPTNKIYAERVVDVNVTSEDSNDSESNKLMIDEGASAKSKDIKPKPLQEEYEVDIGINDVSKMSDHQIHVDEVDNKNSEDVVKVVERSIYDEDSLDEELHFCYEPNLEPKISVQQNNEDLNLAEKHHQLPPQDKKVVSISTFLSASVENSKTSFESSKPFRTKAERKAYNQPGPNPYISIERLNVSTTENNVPIEKQNRSKSLDIGILKNIGGNSKSPHSKENLKHPSSIEVEPEEKTVENTASVMITAIKEEIYNNELTGDNIHVVGLSENSERHRKVNELGDFDETPLAERIKKESQECLAETSLPEEIVIKSKIKSKRLKTTKKKGTIKISKMSGKPDLQDMYKAAPKPKKEETDSLANTNVLQENKPPDVFHSLSTIDSKKVDDNIQIKFENLEDNSNRNYYTLPKLRRKSISKDKLNRSVSSTTDLVSTSDIKDEDVKCMPPPKMRGKSSASVERFKEQNTELHWKCKNTVSPTTEKLSKKLREEDPSVKVEMSLSQKPLVDSIEQPQYKFCERNLAISDLPPESEFSNLLNLSLKEEISSDSILMENFAKSTREDSLYENSNKSNDIVYDLSLKPHRKVSDITENEKPVSATKVEEITIITEHKHLATVGAFTEQEEDKIKEDVQNDNVSMESKKSLKVETSKPDIDLENPFNLDSCPSEDVADILPKPESPKENKGQPLGDCNPEISQDLLLNNKSNTSAIIDRAFLSKKKSFNNLQDLNAETLKNVIGSDGRNEAEECEKTQTDIGTKLSQTNGDQKIQISISNTPDLPNESNKTPDLFNEESICNIKSVMKTELKKRKSHVDLSEGSKQNKKRKSRKDLNVVSSTATVDTENSTDTYLIEVVGPGFKSEKPLENEVRKRKTLGIRKMRINHKQKALDASKSPPNFVNVIESEKLHSKKTDSAGDDIENKVANEEIEDEISQTETGSTPELNVCPNFFSKTSKSESELNIQEISPTIQKQVQSEESTTDVSINSGKIEVLLVSLDEHISTKKSRPNSDSKSHSSGGKKIDAVIIVKQEVQDVHITAQDGEEDIGSDSTQNSSSISASKIVTEIKEPHGEKINEVIQVSEGKPLQKILKRSLSRSRSCSDDVDEGMDKHHKKLNKISSSILHSRSYSHGGIEIVKENSKKSEKENSNLKTSLSLISRSESNIHEDILKCDNEEIMKDRNNKSPTIPRLSPHIEEVFETPEESFVKVQNQLIYVQKPDSDKTVTIADTAILSSQAPQTGHLKNSCRSDNVYNSAVLEITQKDDHSKNENQTSANFLNNILSSNPVSLEETEKIHSSDNTNKNEVTCCLKDRLSSTDVPIKSNQEFCLETQGRSYGPDTLEASLEAKDSTSEDKEIFRDLDISVVNSQMSLGRDKEIICDNYGGENNLKENQKFCGYGLDNIKRDSLPEITEMSAIQTLDNILPTKLPIETFTKDYSLIMESESISVSNEIEFGHNVVEEKSNNETVDEYELANSNITITESNSTIDESNKELTADTGTSQLFSSIKYVEADSMDHFLKSVSVQDGKTELVTKSAPLITDLSKEEIPVINRDFSKSVQELSGPEVVKINVYEEISQSTDFPNICKRKKIISSEPDSEKTADESNAEKSSMRERTILIDNSSVVKKSSLFESPRKRERKSIESVVNHLKEKEGENSTSFDSTIPVTVESVKNHWVSSIEGGCKEVFADFNSSLCLKSDEIPDIHSEVVVSSDQPDLNSSSMSPEGYTNQNFIDASCTMKYENNHSIEQVALGKTTENNEQVISRNKDLKPLHFTPDDDDDIFRLGDSRQSTDIEESCKTSNLSEECSYAKAMKITNLSHTESSARDANVEETIQNLANLSHFGKPTYFDSKSDFHLNILEQISENSFITGDSGSPKDITDIIPVPKQADFSQSFKNTYEGNNCDHSYYNYNTADPVMSIAAEEDLFSKGMSDASSELLSNDNPLRDFELSDDFSDFLNTKGVSEGKDSEGKDSESNQNDDYNLKIYNETITQNLVEISRSRQSKEINKLYDLLDGDKMEPDYIAEPSRDHGLWESIIGSDQSTQKVIVLPNNHCPTSPFHVTHLIENDQNAQGVIEPNNDCLTPPFNMSHTDLYNSFDVSTPGPPCYNPMPPEKAESVESLNESLADFGNNNTTLGTSKKDSKEDSPVDLKKPKKMKKSVPKKLEKDLNGVQPDVLPTRSYGRTKPSQWIKSSKSSSPPVEKQDPIADSSKYFSKEVISTDNLLELSFRNSTRILPKKPIVIQGIPATKTTDIASTRIANTSSVSIKEQTRQTTLKLDTPKTRADIPIVQPTTKNLNEKVYSLTNNVDANVSKSSDAGSLPRVSQYKVTPMKYDHKLPLRKLSIVDFEHDSVVQNIADIVKSRKRVATNLYSSKSLEEENVKNSSKRRKTPTELNFNGKPTGSVKTKTAVNSTEPVARVVEGDNSRRSQSRGSSRSSVNPTSDSEDPIGKRFKIDEKSPQPAGSKYSVNYSIDRILGEDNNSANESRHSNEGPVKDCRERESRDFTKSLSGTGFKTEPEVGKTYSSVMEDAFDRLIRHKNKTPSYSPRKHSTLRESRYHRNTERGFNNERMPRDGSTRVPSAVPHDQRSQERYSRAGNKQYATYQGHSRDHPPYLPEQRKSDGYYPSTGSGRHSNDRQHSGVSSSRSNVSQPNSRPPRVMTGKDKEEWSSPLVERGYLQKLSSPLFPPPQKSPRDIL